jgi:uncharacterized zinc-type alcohol dehydrogenase-like protein
MTLATQAYAVERPGGPVRVLEYEPAPLGALEVEVAVTHCGVCHTDVGMVDDEWGVSAYPVVAGHEAIGVITALGDAVDRTRLSIGQRVGVGATAGACFACEWCLDGRQHLCPDKDNTAVRGTGGGFASHVRASDWRHGVRPTDHVAVVGVGGLGHLAIQFLAKWGCHVTAVSSTPGKESDARRFGAHDFVVSGEGDGDGLRRVANAFDFVLSTVSADLPWDAYVGTLRPHGTLCVVGMPDESLKVHPQSLLSGERSIVGGVTGPPAQIRLMLDFVARHGIRPAVETFSVARMDEALDHVRHGRARYRAVLEL